ncbi:helix-turn-helix domain-containing protein [Sphingomonas sp. BK481]|jgi:DNA-binding transcriptional MerR regulator|uniref:MerR family transcriptional regulator n=1 Tax=Sphingomonas sp. BK481 TaxID=2586981 RepID=UPI00161CB012|nr:helix-turn-helix domain-containing protein [Sphingomonas sp. BK481]MBB3589349.1 DNA-binding transcriptional MerR regulator [Sphingomonas sp. BK481]
MKIGDIAKRTGLKVETVRFYEGEGLIDAPRRSGGNYRLYDESHLDRLTFIKRSRDLGFTLDQVRDLLRLADDPRGSCDAVDEMAVLHIAEIDRKLADLQALRDEIVKWGRCDATTIAECRLIDALSSKTPERASPVS